MVKKSIVFGIIFLMIFNLNSKTVFAANKGPQGETSKSIFQLPENLKVHGFISEQIGFNNNVKYNPERRRDGFFQTAANVDVTYKVVDKLNLKAGSDFLNLLYLNYNPDNLVNTSPYLGFDYEILRGLTSRNRISYEYVDFSNSINNTYSGMTLGTYLRHFFLPNTYQEAAYEYSWRWWQKQRILEYGGAWDGALMADKRRRDDLYRLRYTFGTYFKRFNLSVSNELSRNYSNYEYEKFYDYISYKLRPALTVFITDKLYTSTSFTYQHYLYKERRIVVTDSPGFIRLRQRDRARYADNYLVTASAYYDITKNFSLGVTYTYNDYAPKDKLFKYTDSVVTGGVYYKF